MTDNITGKPIVIVDPFSSGGLYASAFAAEGLTAVAVISYPEIPAAYAAAFEPGDYTEVLTYDGDFGALVARLRALDPLGVLPGTEIAVEFADALAAEVTPAWPTTPSSPAPAATSTTWPGPWPGPGCRCCGRSPPTPRRRSPPGSRSRGSPAATWW
ncbi:hypothetical protein ACFQ2B_09830 [Streptomyces stramineus]